MEQDGRLPSLYFSLPIFVKKAFKKMKTIPSKKTLIHHHILQFLQPWKFSDFLPKNLILRAEKKNIFRKSYQLIRIPVYSKFPTFSDFEKVQAYFRKNPNFEPFETFYYFSRILRQICYNLVKRNFQVQKRERTSLKVNGKHRVKKRTVWVEDIAPIFYKYCAK